MKALEPSNWPILNNTQPFGQSLTYPRPNASVFPINGGAIPMDGYEDLTIDYLLVSGAGETVTLTIEGSNDTTYTNSTLNLARSVDVTKSAWSDSAGAAATTPIVTVGATPKLDTLSLAGIGGDYKYVVVRLVTTNNTGTNSGTCVLVARRSGSRKA